MCSNTVTCGIVAKLTTSRVRICIYKSHTNLRFNQDLCVIYILLYTSTTLRGPLEVKCQVAGELFLQIQTRLVISFATIPHMTIFEHIPYLTFRGPWGSNGGSQGHITH